jgi:6-phosphogluconolactonase
MELALRLRNNVRRRPTDSMPDANVHIYASAGEAARACGQRAAELLIKRLAEAGYATLAVSGGSTPKMMFPVLAASAVDWKRVHLFQVDERLVPPEDAQSNYRLIHAELITPTGIPSENVHRIRGEMWADAAADRYAEEIRRFFRIAPGVCPVFDVVHRGMGAEGHTASLFPGEPLIGDTTRIAAAVTVPVAPLDRVTLLPGPLAAARHTLMLVSGSDKAPALQRVLTRKYEPFHVPAQIGTFENPRAEWYIDSAAAALIRQS